MGFIRPLWVLQALPRKQQASRSRSRAVREAQAPARAPNTMADGAPAAKRLKKSTPWLVAAQKLQPLELPPGIAPTDPAKCIALRDGRMALVREFWAGVPGEGGRDVCRPCRCVPVLLRRSSQPACAVANQDRAPETTRCEGAPPRALCAASARGTPRRARSRCSARAPRQVWRHR